MANVGKATAGKTLIGKGLNASPAFDSIGTDSGLTAKGIVVAQGDSAFTATSSGTAGQVLTSNGIGSDPTFQNPSAGSPLTTKGDIYTYSTEDARLPIGTNEHTLIADSTQITGNKWGVLQATGGGTGQSTFSTGNILYASASNTLSKLSPGGIPGGQLIIGFDNVVQWFDPRKHVILYEEFVTAKTDSGGTYNWDMNSNSGTLRSNIDAVSTNPGFVQLETANTSAGAPNACLFEFGGAGGFILGAGRLYCHWIVKLSALSDGTDTYTTQIGMGDNQGIAQDNGFWFEYTHSVNSGNWTIRAENNTTQTSSNTSTAVTTNWVLLGMEVNATATSVAYYINGAQVANSPIITNIPTLNIGPFAAIVKSVGTTNIELWLDQFYLYQELTTPR